MSKMANLILLAVAVSLVFVSGCKDKPTPEAQPVEPAPVESAADVKPVAEKPITVEPITEKPVSVEPVSVEPVVEKPVVVAPVEEKKTETPAVPVVSTVSDEAKSEEGGGDIWMTDYKAAMKKAAAEKKDMLLDFSGSDWCGWCIRLDKEVFSQKEFIKAASKDFVFVILDFPRDKSLTTPQLQQQNYELKKKYGAQYFPTVILTDAKGMPYAQTGYLKGGPKAYLAHLAEFRKANIQVAELMSKADNADIDDAAKAKFLDQAVSLMSPELVANFYSDRIEKIIALDSENKAGLRDNYLAKRALKGVAMQLRERNADTAIELIDKIIKDYKVSGRTAQEIYYYRAMAFDFKEDKAETLENLKKSIAADPKSKMAANIREIIKTYFSESKPKPAEEPKAETTVEKTSE